MTLRLICGPTGSGKTALAVDAFLAALGDGLEPVFIAPSGPDARHFERGILKRGGVVSGGRVMTFDRLCRAILHAANEGRRVIGEVERSLVIRAVIDGMDELSFLKGSSGFDGFIRAVARLFDDLQEAGVGPVELGRKATGIVPEDLNTDIYRLFQGYLDALEDQEVIDTNQSRRLGLDLLRGDASLLGFDMAVVDGFWDFTPLEREFTGSLAAAPAGLLVTLPYEEGRTASAAVGQHFDIFRRLPDAKVEHLKRPVDDGRHEALIHLDAGLFEDGAARVSPRTAIGLLEGTGVRGQAELVAAEILRLNRRQQVPLDDMAVVCRGLGGDALAVCSVFEAFQIPFDFQGRVALKDTPVGQTALAALEMTDMMLGANTGSGTPGAGPTGETASHARESLLRYLRSALPVAPDHSVDEFARRTGFQGITALDRLMYAWRLAGGRDLDELPGLAAAAMDGPAELGRTLCQLFQQLLSGALGGEEGGRLYTRDNELDLLSLKALHQVCREAGQLRPGRSRRRQAVRLLRDGLETAVLESRAGNYRNCVRIVDPHRVLNQRFRVVFLCGLLEKQWPSMAAEDPFLPNHLRKKLALEKNIPLSVVDDDDHLAQERFLFHRAITRARDQVYLCHPHCDSEGRLSVPSLFIDETLDLFTGVPRGQKWRKRASETAFALDRAPTPALALQSLCLEAGEQARRGRRIPRRTAAALAAAAKPVRLEKRLSRCLDAGSAHPEAALGPEALAEFAVKEWFSATALEAYATCPYRYFVERVLAPTEMSPDTFFLDRGSLAHCVLARFGLAMKRAGVVLWDAGTTSTQVAAAHDQMDLILDEAVAERGLNVDLDGWVMAATLRFYLHRYIDRQVASDGRLVPAYFEFPFGDPKSGKDCGGSQSSREALVLGGRFKVTGTIDRIDILPDSDRALVVDYKTTSSKNLPPSDRFLERGSIQIQIYMMALQRVMGLRPIGGEYFALADGKPQGVFLESEGDVVGPARLPGRLGVTAEEMDDILRRSEELAVSLAAGICAAEFTATPRDPKTCQRCGCGGICRGAHV